MPPAGVGAYEVSGKQVLTQWFSYRKRDRERPIIGDRRPPSQLGDIQPDHWLAEYTTELLNVLNVSAASSRWSRKQADLLARVCAGQTVAAGEFAALAPVRPGKSVHKRGRVHGLQGELIE